MNSRLVHGLLWREWLLHQGELRWVFAAWLFGVWVFPLPPLYFLLPFGVIGAMILAPSFGGADAQEESEEFSFSLPPTRAQRYVVRLGLGGGALLAMLVVGLLSGLFDLPQRVWGLLFESGFTVPFRQLHQPTVYALAIAAPVAVFGECFAAGASLRTPSGMNTVWLRGLFVVGILMLGVSLLEQQCWKEVTGVMMVPALIFWAGLRLTWSYRDYRWKEGVSGLPRMIVSHRGSRLWLVLLIVLAVVVAMAVLFLFAGTAPVPPSREF